MKGSTTTSSKIPLIAEAGILPFEADFSKDVSESTLLHVLNAEEVVVTLPYSRHRTPQENLKIYSKLARTLAFEEVQRVIMISSTSVYPDDLAVCMEEDADPLHPLVACEKEFLDKIASCCIIRFAGLIGPGRHPGKFYAGKTQIPGPLSPVNLIHLDDCIGVIECALERKSEGIFNACCPSHPSRKEFYSDATHQLGLDLPAFNDSDASPGRTVSSIKLLEEMGYVFTHEDLFDALKNC